MSPNNDNKNGAVGGIGGFLLCTLAGLVFHKLALGMIAGLLFGSAITASLSRRRG